VIRDITAAGMGATLGLTAAIAIDVAGLAWE
jgi:hypothetical protein